jgi:hypothetical protein
MIGYMGDADFIQNTSSAGGHTVEGTLQIAVGEFSTGGYLSRPWPTTATIKGPDKSFKANAKGATSRFAVVDNQDGIELTRKIIDNPPPDLDGKPCRILFIYDFPWEPIPLNEDAEKSQAEYPYELAPPLPPERVKDLLDLLTTNNRDYVIFTRPARTTLLAAAATARPPAAFISNGGARGRGLVLLSPSLVCDLPPAILNPLDYKTLGIE